MQTVAGKTVLITGAAMGLGKLFAHKAVGDKAAAIVLWDINEHALKDTAAELEAAGGTVRSYVVDISCAEAVAAAAAQVRAEAGTVEILFNNAGIVRGNGYFWETSDVRDIEQTLAINSLAPMLVAREFLPDMIKSDADCRIVNIASSAALLSNPRMAVYAASKWALVGLVGLGAPGTRAGRASHDEGHHGMPDLHQHGHVRRREAHALHPHAEAEGGRRRHLEQDAQGCAILDHAVDVARQLRRQRPAAAQGPRLLP